MVLEGSQEGPGEKPCLLRGSININFIEKLDGICEKYELIPSIIKDSRLNLDTIKKCYKDHEMCYKYRKCVINFIAHNL